MFVLDVTESMQPVIDGVRDGIIHFAGELGKQRLDARVGLLAFRDWLINEPDELLLFDGQPFTSDYHAFSEAVGRLRAQGGGDEPESSLDAVVRAAGLPFRPDATKVLVLITDAPPHVPDLKTRTIAEAARAVRDHAIDQLHLVVHANDFGAHYGQLQEQGAPGKWFELKEEVLRFEDILTGLGKQIATTTVESQPKPTLKALQANTAVAEQSGGRLVLAVGLWTAALALGISLSLIAVQNHYLHRAVLTAREGAKGLAGSLAAGAVAGAAGQLLFQQTAEGPWEFAARVASWALLGGLLSGLLTLFVPNLRPGRAVAAGVLGGGLGALGYLAAQTHLGAITGRLVGAATLGFAVGLMVALVEAVFREAWLEVHYGPRESRSVGLGATPVTVGSDPRCTVYVPQAPPVGLRYLFANGEVLCGAGAEGPLRRLLPGDEERLGNVRLVAQAGGEGDAAAPAALPPARGTPLGFTLRLPAAAFPLRLGTRLSQADLPGLETTTAGGLVAEVVPNPKDPSVLGLKNHSCRAWSATLPDGSSRRVDSGRSLALQSRTVIHFGPYDGKIV
jgi:Ca-activated chloride channel family protein